MIINQSEEIDNKNFTPNFEKSFGIKDEAFILQILRTNTYSDPIGSICREVISNCRDSHREAGKAEIPVEVELLEDELSNSKRQLVFRDFGVGLSPERMNEVYSVYGESTKRNSNQFTGGFGLGAKTPFAYTDSFQVKTVYNFIEYTYQLVIDKSEKGKIIEISKEKTFKVSGPRFMPNKILKVTTRRGPCGNGTATFDNLEMKIHTRVIDIKCDPKNVADVTNFKIKPGVDISIKIWNY